MATTDSSGRESEFTGIRSILWPIHRHELKKFLSMGMLMFFIIFVYTMVRDLKDVFVISRAVCGGQEQVNVLKLWVVLPFAAIFVAAYSALINKFGFQKTFFSVVGFYIAFYLIFLLVLLPNEERIHADAETVMALQASWPPFFKHIIPCITNWAYSLFYLMAELWGTMAISSLFWGFANQITKKNEVKRFFGMFSCIGNIGSIVSGQYLKFASVTMETDYKRGVQMLIWACIFSCVMTYIMFKYITNFAKKDPEVAESMSNFVVKKKKKMGIFDGFKAICRSKYLGLIALLVIGYGLSINLIEVIWKAKMHEYFPGQAAYSRMMGNLSTFTGIITIFLVFISSIILRTCSWKVCSLVTPMVMVVFGGGFFLLCIFQMAGGTHILGIPVAMLGIWIGLITDAFIKGIKYVLFDPTKSMAYLPLTADEKTKGQSAVEVVGGRLGKSGGAAYTFFLTSVIAPGSKTISHIGSIITLFVLVVAGWVYSVFGLSKEYEKKMAGRDLVS